jgi:hypothetical protein
MSQTLLARVLVYLLGAFEGLLVARLMVRLFAGRPDNPALGALLTITEPLQRWLATLDAAQPRFGATLEYSTLVMLVLLPALAVVIWRVLGTGRGVHTGYRR